MLACEREGLPVVLHVHDEIVIEVPAADGERSLRRLAEIMSRPPAWAAGFPLAVEAFVAERYFKSPTRGAPRVKATNGAILDEQAAELMTKRCDVDSGRCSVGTDSDVRKGGEIL
jgi:hypothetical protein